MKTIVSASLLSLCLAVPALADGGSGKWSNGHFTPDQENTVASSNFASLPHKHCTDVQTITAGTITTYVCHAWLDPAAPLAGPNGSAPAPAPLTGGLY